MVVDFLSFTLAPPEASVGSPCIPVRLVDILSMPTVMNRKNTWAKFDDNPDPLRAL